MRAGAWLCEAASSTWAYALIQNIPIFLELIITWRAIQNIGSGAPPKPVGSEFPKGRPGKMWMHTGSR